MKQLLFLTFCTITTFVTCVAGFDAKGATTCPPSILWQQSFGGTGLELAGPIELTPDGGYIVAASSNSEPGGNKTSPNFGSDDFWILRLDSSGNKLWERSFGGSGQDIFTTLCKTGDGGYLVGGATQSGQSGNKEIPLQGSSDYWIIRLDSDGNKLWERSYGGWGHEAATQVISTSDGGFMLVGLAWVFPEIFGRYDVWLIKIDAGGNEQWNRYFGGTEDEWPGAILQTADGGYILPIDSNSPISGNRTAPNRGGHDIWLVRLDATGNILWEQSYGGDSEDYPGPIIEYPDGTFLMEATSFSTPSGNKTAPNLGLDDIWLLKLDPRGEKIWERTYGGSGEDSAGEMLLMPDGGLLLAGSSSSMDGDRSGPYFGESDYWLLRLSSTGQVLWDLSLGSSSYEFGGVLRQTPDGGFITAGISYSEPGGNKTSPYFGGIDLWLLKLSPEPTGPCDSDGDGVLDPQDECPNTPPGAIVNKHGCTIEQLAPCDGPWPSHGAYVRTVVRAALEFRKARLITNRQAIAIISRAAKSDCGKKPPRPHSSKHAAH